MDDNSVTQIVCYTGGTCGDLITAMIDSRDARVSNNRIQHHKEREKLKKPHSFGDNNEKDLYLSMMSQVYCSLPSHDLDYHLDRGHEFITIVVKNFSTALWAADRFKKMHRPHVWEEMRKYCGATDVEDYARILIDFSNMVVIKTTKLIRLERILSGDADEDLSAILSRDLNCDIYKQWLAGQ
jgi:hypothetical protein